MVAVLAIAALLPQFKTLKKFEAGLALIANAEGAAPRPISAAPESGLTGLVTPKA
ncbi:hypothetical protein E05_45510 [Plautia stali symbiont]|nr:hypothetical protein E05_45510 [Plautia stali symbiont]